MLKKQYKLFLIIFILTVCVSAWMSRNIPYSYDTPAVSSYTFAVEPSDTRAYENAPLWFSFDDQTVILHADADIADSLDPIRYRHPYGEADSMAVSDFTYTDDCNGTILAQAGSADGKIKATAKSQTLITQGYDALAWDTHSFEDPALPIELCYYGSSTMSADMMVLVGGEPYSGDIHLQTAAGKDEDMTIEGGVLSGLRISDLRKGLAVSITDEADGTILCGTYTVEDYPVFSHGYLRMLMNLPRLALMIAPVCVVILLARRAASRVLTKKDAMQS